MTSFSGADVDALRGLGRELHGASTQFEDARHRLTEQAVTLLWAGPDRERFAHDWLTRFGPAMATVSQAVEAAATHAEANAAQQEQTSAAGGGAVAGATAIGTDAVEQAGGEQATPGTGRYGNPTGELSAQYESRGGVGTVSSGRGDPGGVSYGTYQLATNRGTPEAFVTWAEDHYPEAHERLSGLTPGTAEFGDAWRELAGTDAEGFGQAQHAFIVETHHNPGVDRIVAAVPDFTLEGRSEVVADVVWSTTVQHGAGGAGRVFANALAGEDVATMSDADIIRAVYTERGRDDGMAYFRSSSDAVRRGVVNRFGNEQADALSALGLDP